MSSQHNSIRRTQTLEVQIGRLNAQLGSVKGHVKRFGTGLTLNQLPAWDVVRMDPDTALTGADWDPLFDDLTANNRIQHSLRTASGEVAHVNSDNSATRLRIRFTGQGEGQIPMKLGMNGTGSVQVKCNGTTTSYSAGAFIAVDVLPPPMTNELVITADGTGGAFQFSLDGPLFDGVNRRWVSY